MSAIVIPLRVDSRIVYGANWFMVGTASTRSAAS